MTIEVEHVEDETAHDGVEGGGGGIAVRRLI